MPRKGENIYRRKDGRWEGRYIKSRKQNGKIIYGYIYGQKYREVKEKLFRMKINYHEFYLSPKQKSSSTDEFQQWIYRWLINKKNRVQPNTYISYKSKMLNHVIPKIGNYKLSELTSESLQKFINELSQTLSIPSVNGTYRVLNTCLKEAIREKLIFFNPLNSVYVAKQPIRKVLAFSKEEQKRLENRAIFERDFPIIFTLYTGLRIGELSGLCWEDVNWEESILIIQRNNQPHTLSYKLQNSSIITDSLKTKSSQRVLPIGKKMIENLSQWRKLQQSRYIFSNRSGGPMEPRTLRYRFEKLKENANVPNYPFHSLRHTFATRCIEIGVPITTISSLMGHQSVKMTLDVYTNSFLSEKRQAIEKLEKIS